MNRSTLLKLLTALVMVLALVILGLPGNAGAASTDQAGAEPELAAIASDLIKARNQLLVGASTAAALREYPAARQWQRVDRSALRGAIAERAFLKAHGEEYTSFETDIQLETVVPTDAGATLTLVEHTSLFLRAHEADAFAPAATEYFQRHEFIFARKGNKWLLTAHRLLDGPVDAVASANEPLAPLPITGETLSDIEADFRRLQTEQSAGQIADHSGPVALVPAAPQATLDRTRIINYAYQYWSNYNSAYRSFSGNDCTNFVSQAVRAGGWPDVLGLHTSNSAWWYNFAGQSYTWVNAHRWALFTLNRPRASQPGSVLNLMPGDILQMDFFGDGTIDHTMIVTKKDSNGTIYLTYHTSNTKDKSIWSIAGSYPNARYYAWRLYSTYN